MFLVNKKKPKSEPGHREKLKRPVVISDNRATGDINLELPQSIF